MPATDASIQPPTSTTHPATGAITVPRITIQFCTQCKWNLRAAYYAQELLQTFSTSLGEVALLPATSGIFVIKLYQRALDQEGTDEDRVRVEETVLWDRKVDNCFPETKELKGRVRDAIEPGRGLGHTDRALKKAKDPERSATGQGRDAEGNAEGKTGDSKGQGETCEDCR